MNEEKPEKTTLTIDGIEHDFASLTDEQKIIFQHIMDLDRKIQAAKFQLDQLMVGREAFFNRLKSSLSKNLDS